MQRQPTIAASTQMALGGQGADVGGGQHRRPRVGTQRMVTCQRSIDNGNGERLLAQRASGWRCEPHATKRFALLQGCATAIAKIDKRVKHLQQLAGQSSWQRMMSVGVCLH